MQYFFYAKPTCIKTLPSQYKSTWRNKNISQHSIGRCHSNHLSQRGRLCDSLVTIHFSLWLSTLTSHFQVSDSALKWSNSHKTLAYKLRLCTDAQITFTQAFHCNVPSRLYRRLVSLVHQKKCMCYVQGIAYYTIRLSYLKQMTNLKKFNLKKLNFSVPV